MHLKNPLSIAFGLLIALPRAAVRALLQQEAPASYADRCNEQIDRMDEIVRYQLRKPAASQVDKFAFAQVPVAREVERLADGLRKVYHDKQPQIEVEVTDGLQFRGDSGDFLEIAGNLLDNACKWCRKHVRISVRAADSTASGQGMVLTVADDGPGVPADSADALLQRGTRLDEKTPGHGIGLAVVKELAESYGGHLEIGQADLGGAEFRVTVPASRSS